MYSLFRDLAIIILSAKFFGLVARKCKAPQVVGEIIAGLLIGPCLLNLVQISDSISIFAEIGVVMLMFTTGLGTNLKELIKAGPIATLIATVGVAVPLVGGTLLYGAFYGFAAVGSPEFYRALFIGTIMTATSVSITVATLQELGHLKSFWARLSSVPLSLMMSSASWCSPACWVPAAAPVRVWARCCSIRCCSLPPHWALALWRTTP